MLLTFSSYMSLQAWFRRGKANASLGNHEDAMRDLSISLELEASLSGKRQIEKEMTMILDQSKDTYSSLRESNECRLDINGMTLYITNLLLLGLCSNQQLVVVSSYYVQKGNSHLSICKCFLV